MQDKHKAILLWALSIIGISLFIVFVWGATTKEKTDALAHAQEYILSSDGSVWNASDFMAIGYFAKKYNVSVLPGALAVEGKSVFDKQKYSFTQSILKGTILPPTDFEKGLGTSELYWKIWTCKDFTTQDLEAIANSTNTINEPYSATHAIFFLDQISDTYTLQCGKQATAMAAEAAKQIAKNGLNLPPNPKNLGGFDAYLSQECARGLVFGNIPAPVIDLVVSTQDQNKNEPLTYGGWYHSGKRLNEPYDLKGYYDEKGVWQTDWYYPELPNGHTTSMAVCLLLIDLGVST